MRKSRAARRARSGLGSAPGLPIAHMRSKAAQRRPAPPCEAASGRPLGRPPSSERLRPDLPVCLYKARCEARPLLLQVTARWRRQRTRRAAVASATTPLPPRAAATKQSTIRSRKVVSRTNVSHKQAHNNKSTTQCPGGWPALTLLECKAARPTRLARLGTA